ncbi:MAG: hypothetical protein EBU03_02280 [Methylophilaceae bacterium]|nr:hypothetical protein [Methylophilaceae bacterium]
MAEKYDVLAQKSAPLSSALGTGMPVIPTRKDGSPDYIAGYKAYKEPMLKETKRLLEEQGAFEGLQREEETRQKGMLATGKAENLRKLKSDIEESQTAKDLTTLEDQYMHAAFVPTQATMGEMAAMFSLFGVAGMLIGAGGKGNSQAAMSAMSGMMKGYREGNEDLYKKEKATFDENLKVMGQRKDVLSKRLEQIAKLATMDKDAADQDLDALLAEQGADFYKKYKDKFGIAKLLELDKEVNKTHDKIYDLAIKEDERVREETRRRTEKLAEEQRRKEDKIEAEKRALADKETFAKFTAGLTDKQPTQFMKGDDGVIYQWSPSKKSWIPAPGLPAGATEKLSGAGGRGSQTQQQFENITSADIGNAYFRINEYLSSSKDGKIPEGSKFLRDKGTQSGIIDAYKNYAINGMMPADLQKNDATLLGIAFDVVAARAFGRASGVTDSKIAQVVRQLPVEGDNEATKQAKMRILLNQLEEPNKMLPEAKRKDGAEYMKSPVARSLYRTYAEKAETEVETGRDEKGSFHYEYNEDKTKRRKVYD